MTTKYEKISVEQVTALLLCGGFLMDKDNREKLRALLERTREVATDPDGPIPIELWKRKAEWGVDFDPEGCLGVDGYLSFSEEHLDRLKKKLAFGMGRIAREVLSHADLLDLGMLSSITLAELAAIWAALHEAPTSSKPHLGELLSELVACVNEQGLAAMYELACQRNEKLRESTPEDRLRTLFKAT